MFPSPGVEKCSVVDETKITFGLNEKCFVLQELHLICETLKLLNSELYQQILQENVKIPIHDLMLSRQCVTKKVVLPKDG